MCSFATGVSLPPGFRMGKARKYVYVSVYTHVCICLYICVCIHAHTHSAILLLYVSMDMLKTCVHTSSSNPNTTGKHSHFPYVYLPSLIGKNMASPILHAFAYVSIPCCGTSLTCPRLLWDPPPLNSCLVLPPTLLGPKLIGTKEGRPLRAFC